jgi:hypothetical protein
MHPNPEPHAPISHQPPSLSRGAAQRAFDYNKMPLAPLGMKVLIHETPNRQRTWAVHGVDGWYLSGAPEHYRCYTVYATKTRAECIAHTVKFFPHYGQMPQLSSANAAIRAAIELCWALCNPSPASAIAPIGDAQLEAVNQLAAIFALGTHRPPPGPPEGRPFDRGSPGDSRSPDAAARKPPHARGSSGARRSPDARPDDRPTPGPPDGRPTSGTPDGRPTPVILPRRSTPAHPAPRARSEPVPPPRVGTAPHPTPPHPTPPHPRARPHGPNIIERYQADPLTAPPPGVGVPTPRSWPRGLNIIERDPDEPPTCRRSARTQSPALPHPAHRSPRLRAPHPPGSYRLCANS